MKTNKTLTPIPGMKVRPHSTVKNKPKEWDGVIVYVVPPSETDHGCVAVWLSEKCNYGGDNCEHYAYYSDEQIATVLKEIK